MLIIFVIKAMALKEFVGQVCTLLEFLTLKSESAVQNGTAEEQCDTGDQNSFVQF